MTWQCPALSRAAEPAQHFAGCKPAHRMAPSRGDRDDRLDHEWPFGYSRMRQDQASAGRLADHAMIVDQIELERPGSPANGAPPPGATLERMQAAHQRFRGKVGLDARDGIHKRRLVEPAERRRDCER